MKAKPIVLITLPHETMERREARMPLMTFIRRELIDDYHVIAIEEDMKLEVLNMEHIKLTDEQKKNVEKKIEEILNKEY